MNLKNQLLNINQRFLVDMLYHLYTAFIYIYIYNSDPNYSLCPGESGTWAGMEN